MRVTSLWTVPSAATLHRVLLGTRPCSGEASRSYGSRLGLEGQVGQQGTHGRACSQHEAHSQQKVGTGRCDLCWQHGQAISVPPWASAAGVVGGTESCSPSAPPPPTET